MRILALLFCLTVSAFGKDFTAKDAHAALDHGEHWKNSRYLMKRVLKTIRELSGQGFTTHKECLNWYQWEKYGKDLKADMTRLGYEIDFEEIGKYEHCVTFSW